MFAIQNKKIFLLSSLSLVIVSIVLIFTYGLKPSIEFTGGSMLEVSYSNQRPEISEIENSIQNAGFSAVIQPAGDSTLIVKTKDIQETEKQELLQALNVNGDMEEISFTSIGPSIGHELKTKAIYSLIIVSIAIILFIAYTFRKVSKPVSSWKYGFVAIITLVHDVVLTAGVFAILGITTGAEVDMLFIVALLTILGLSVNDTIVIFDRIRENIQRNVDQIKPFRLVVGESLKQSYARSLNTSLSTIVVLLALAFFGPESTKMFALTLTFGMFFGTYSSIFLASPLLVQMYEWQKNK
jgi:preprotein translocase subunit SecF